MENCASCCRYARSAPAQKAGPLPSRTTTRISGYSFAVSKASDKGPGSKHCAFPGDSEKLLQWEQREQVPQDSFYRLPFIAAGIQITKLRILQLKSAGAGEKGGRDVSVSNRWEVKKLKRG